MEERIRESRKIVFRQEKEDHDAQFPIGMKVLAIDANIVCLKYLVQLLLHCQYQVTSTTEAAEAIKLLRDKKKAFDIVITDVVRADMDGFKLLQIITLERDIPVVMVSARDEVDIVKRGVMEGAHAYLVKPVRIEEIRSVWQHVIRKKIEKKSSDVNNMRSVKEENEVQKQKRRRCEQEDEGNKTRVDESSKKKPRVTWSTQLHLKFLQAYDQLGEKERVPNNILTLMNVPGLTRENVASHLQKHRDGLRRKKETENKILENSPILISNAIIQRERIPNDFTSSTNFLSNHIQACNNNLDDFLFDSDFSDVTAHLFAPNDLNMDFLPPFDLSCLTSKAQAYENSMVENIGEIPQLPSAYTWPFPSNIIAGESSGECFGVELNRKSSSSHSQYQMSSLMGDSLSEIFNRIS